MEPAGDWNNVVPYAKHKGQYGRNFAVATARRNVLRGSNDTKRSNFDPTKDFKVLKEAPDGALLLHDLPAREAGGRLRSTRSRRSR